MSAEPEEPEDLASLYRLAFAEYGHALWNLRPVKLPTPVDALAITQALRTHGRMEGRRSLNASKIFAVPITKFQSDVLRSLAAHRSPDSYIAGGVAINREGPRYSADIDIFHDSEARLESAARTEWPKGAAYRGSDGASPYAPKHLNLMVGTAIVQALS